MNEITVIAPYKYHGMWVFNDPLVGLAREPFVSGVDTMIDRVVANIADAENGFVMICSGAPLPRHQYSLEWRRADLGGCPALPQYFREAQKEIYVQVKSRAAG